MKKQMKNRLIGSVLLISVLFLSVLILIISSRYFFAFKLTFAFIVAVIFSNVLSRFVMKFYHRQQGGES